MESTTLIYCTDGYPGDIYSEKVFVDSELPALLEKFDRIIIVPIACMSRNLGYSEALPDRVVTEWSLAEDKTVHSHIRKLRYLFNPFVIWSLFAMHNEARSLKQWIKGLYQGLTAIAISRRIKALAKKYELTPENTILYSIWFYDSAAALALLAEKEGWRMATRAHTGDLYDEKLLFRSRKARGRLLQSVEKVFTISRGGKEYLDKKFPEHTDKFEWLTLGSTKIYKNPIHFNDSDGLKGKDNDRPLELVTVARLVPIKRHELIMDVLAEVVRRSPKNRIRWTIIGDGECLDQLRQKADDINLPGYEIRFEGRKSNSEIQRLYADNPPDWYIMMSYSEGVPVSMGEAMSYGIPVITTDVGEIKELADDSCAIFLDRDISVDAAANRLSHQIFNLSLNRKMGEAAAKRWEEVFDSSRTSVRLAESLASLPNPVSPH